MTANDVDAALAAPLDEVGARLAAIAEDQWFERKSIRIHAKDLGRPLVALANAEGGVIVVGIAAGQVEGMRNHLGKLNEFRQAPWTSPSLRCGLASIKSGCRNQEGETDNRSRTGATGTTRQLLSARSLLTPKGELTNGGDLLFAAHPLSSCSRRPTSGSSSS